MKKNARNFWPGHSLIAPVVLLMGVLFASLLYLFRERRDFNYFAGQLVAQSADTVDVFVSSENDVPPQVSVILNKCFYDEPTYGIIYRMDRKVVRSNLKSQGIQCGTLDDFVALFPVSDEVAGDINFALSAGTDGLEVFRSRDGFERIFVRHIHDTDLSLAIAIPSASFMNVVKSRMKNSGMFILVVALILLGYLIAVSVRSSVLSREMKDKAEKELKETSQLVVEQETINEALSRIYFATYYADFSRNIYREINSPDDFKDKIPRKDEIEVAAKAFLQYGVSPASRGEMSVFMDLSSLGERLRNVQSIARDYESFNRGWCRATWVVASRDDEGNMATAVFVLAEVDDIISADLEHKKKLRELNATLESYNQALNDAKEEAETANNAKTRFLFNMSHDIRTPMNAILGFTQLLEIKQNDPDVVSEYVHKIKDAGEYLLTIINNVLDMAKIESGNAVLDMGIWDLRELDETALTVFEEQIKEKCIHVTRTMDVEHRFIAADATKIKQIWVNLISNSLKYTPLGGNVDLVVQEESCEREGYARYRATISDTGVGMSEEFQTHIFEPFSREKNSTDSKVMGTGLGMAIVKKLVDLMDGTIEVESQLGKGSRFTVITEHKIMESPEKYKEESLASEVDYSLFKGKRILLAEDNQLNAEIASAILENNGFEVEWARDGVECLDMFLDEAPGYYDCILMDIQMPNLNGYATTEKIRGFADDQKSRIPIIAMTANAFDEDKRKAYEYGMDGHIAKPINVEKLMQTLSNVLRGV